MTSSLKYMVVADGGASKCAMALYAVADGTRLAETVQGPASLSLDVSEAWHAIEKGIRELASELGFPTDWQPDLLVMGLAGSLRESRIKAFTGEIRHCRRYLIFTDGQAQYMGATGGNSGVCLSVGTGSVVYWMNGRGVLAHAGGWGFPAGDEASGAWLGLCLIKRYINDRDYHSTVASSEYVAAPSGQILYRALENTIGVEVTDVQQWSTQKNPTRLATLAPLVQTAAENNDPIANELLDHGAQECMNLINLAPANLPVYLAGSVVAYYHSRLIQCYGDRIRPVVGDAVSGLFHLGFTHQAEAIEP